MRRFAPLFWVLVIVVASFVLYRVKYEVRSIEAQIATTSHQLETEREAMHVVAAEWAYLNRPERLQALAAKYLNASDVTVDQIAEVEAIPFSKQGPASIDGEEGIRPASLKVSKEPGDAE